jgi:hypothetical protein
MVKGGSPVFWSFLLFIPSSKPVDLHMTVCRKLLKKIQLRFYLFGSSDQTNNGSEISDPNVLICKYRK